MSTLDAMAIAVHKIYMSFKRAGFTDQQALELTKVALAQSLALAQSQGKGE